MSALEMETSRSSSFGSFAADRDRQSRIRPRAYPFGCPRTPSDEKGVRVNPHVTLRTFVIWQDGCTSRHAMICEAPAAPVRKSRSVAPESAASAPAGWRWEEQREAA